METRNPERNTTLKRHNPEGMELFINLEAFQINSSYYLLWVASLVGCFPHQESAVSALQVYVFSEWCPPQMFFCAFHTWLCLGFKAKYLAQLIYPSMVLPAELVSLCSALLL